MLGGLFGYGENALTLLLLGAHAPAFVRPLEGGAPADAPLVLYRPSFGRRATKRVDVSAVAADARAPFGEFDAIVTTPGGTYLVETKWPASAEVGRDGVIALRLGQVRRHAVMRRYLVAWRTRASGGWATWAAFTAESGIRGALGELDVSVPAPKDRLATTLAWTLAALHEGGPVRDLVLCVHARDAASAGAAAVAPTRARPHRVHTPDEARDYAPEFALLIAEVGRDVLGPPLFPLPAFRSVPGASPDGTVAGASVSFGFAGAGPAWAPPDASGAEASGSDA